MKTSQKTTPKVVQTKIISAKRSEVFEAWTKPEIVQQWLCPEKWTVAIKEHDLRIGGRYAHEMINPAPSIGSDGKANTCRLHTGEYLEIKPPEKLVFTWNTEHVKNTRVTVELRDRGDATELTLTHEFLPDEHQATAHAQGWSSCLAHLESHFSK